MARIDKPDAGSVMTSADVRAHLIDTLRLDLIGPHADIPSHTACAHETLPTAPSKWYLSGFLVPFEASLEQRSDDTGDDELDQAGDRSPGDDERAPEQASARKALFPSSMGLSVLVPAGIETLTATVSWGDYRPLASDNDAGSTRANAAGSVWGSWRRSPRQEIVEVPLADDDADAPSSVPVPESDGLRLVVSARTIMVSDVSERALVPAGTRSVSVFLVNERAPAADNQRDAAYVFQVELSLECPTGFIARPDPRGHSAASRRDPDERVADVQYRNAFEYAVGHNVSAVAGNRPFDHDGGASEDSCTTVHTAWMPVAAVERVVHRELDEADLGMEALAGADSADAVRAMVTPMLARYDTWIDDQTERVAVDPLMAVEGRARVAARLLSNAKRANQRIRDGLAALDDPFVLQAFRIANRSVAAAFRRRKARELGERRARDAWTKVRPPAWRPFQLAFVMMNLSGLADAEHPDRELVDLLFFPTGGGKTEAYLGLAAFVMVLRRLRDPSVHSAGVSVLMRYTLRLLTLDQLERAAALVCALELERQADISALGPWPFEIGLWVGQTATPNRMGRKGDNNKYAARTRTLAFQKDPKRKPSPIPLETCPWCGARFKKGSFQLFPDPDEPRELRVMCVDRGCDFHSRAQPRGLPILAIDEPLYRRLPAFLIATVDKFANLPWVGETGALFGRVQRYDDDGFYGPCDRRVGRALERPLPPPDLVIQDELHLISGPLGTMVGLYETAIDALAARDSTRRRGRQVLPKVIASTATVRQASRQIRGLFARQDVDVFPPPGPDRRDSFFARTASVDEQNPRLYVGVAAQGRNLKVMLLRAYLTLLAAGQRAWKQAGGAKSGDNPADPYMTLLGYFNSLRELGGSRRIVEDEVQARLADYGAIRRRAEEKPGARFANRLQLKEPEELTSRVGTNQIADTKRRLALSFASKERVDVALATNMISVGLDITRLGLMVVLGQPKTAAEYIQATSRVGRDPERPGLVVTLLNVHRPRDRSHYERFSVWHGSFYRAVEATSVTPFSARAVDRGIAGVTVALARHKFSYMTPAAGATEISGHVRELEAVADIIARRAEGHDIQMDAHQSETLRRNVRQRVLDLLDSWERVASKAGELQYQREVSRLPPLLYDPLDRELDAKSQDARKFTAQRSLRDVEPSVALWIRSPDGRVVEDEL